MDLQSESGPTVLLFGPQALSLDEDILKIIRAALVKNDDYRWILDTIYELPTYWKELGKEIPSIKDYHERSPAPELKELIENASFSGTSFPPPNYLLTPLVVTLQLLQYLTYLKSKYPDSEDRQQIHNSSAQNLQSVGFCTGFLTAIAVSCSSNDAQLRKYGATAIRIAMLIGAVVDTQDFSGDEETESRSFSVAWNSLPENEQMIKILDTYPDVSDS